MTQAFIEQTIARSLAAALASYTNAPGRIGVTKSAEDTRKTAPEVDNLTYEEFLNCGPRIFNGTEGALELCKWFKEVERIFQCSNCSQEDKIKFATCTFQGRTLKWWNTYVQQVGVDAAYSTPWDELRKMMIEEYCSRSELRAMEQEIWSLTMKGGGYLGKKPLCDRCKMHHTGPCIAKCGKCRKIGHKTRDCKAAGINPQPAMVTCYGCGEKGHYKN